MTKLYIAYGSNLCKRQMRIRCPYARPLGKFIMTSARLVFRGVADLEYSPGEETPCGLWAVQAADERELDFYEGVARGIYIKSDGDVVLRYKGQKRGALVYVMRSQGIFPPSQYYADIIRQGYKDFGLDETYLDAAISQSYFDKQHDLQTAARRVNQKKDPRHQRLVAMPETIALKRLEANPVDQNA